MSKLTSNILASASPRRRDLLNKIGIEFSVKASNIDEDFKLNLPPEAFTEHWAREKALNISNDHPSSLIIGADTVVVLDDQILGKPKDKNGSKEMLLKLSGKTHEVITGVSLIHIDSEIDITFNERTFVSINTLTRKDISQYIKFYKPFDKAGSYGIQDGFSVYIDKIDGCYYNVMGLPVSKFYSYYRNIVANQ
tara:strand:- start:103 stop:684 length:582 start_codon:yes stop_codon:yes gene_type:complete